MLPDDLNQHAARIEELYTARNGPPLRPKGSHLLIRCVENESAAQLVRDMTPRDHIHRIWPVVILGLLVTLLAGLAMGWARDNPSERVWVSDHPIASPFNFALYGVLGTFAVSALVWALLFIFEPCVPAPLPMLTWDPVTRRARVHGSARIEPVTIECLLCSVVYLRNGGRTNFTCHVECIVAGKPLLLGRANCSPEHAMKQWQAKTGIPYFMLKTRTINRTA